MLPYFSWQFSVGSFQLLNFELIFVFILFNRKERKALRQAQGDNARFAKFYFLAKTLRRKAFSILLIYFIFYSIRLLFSPDWSNPPRGAESRKMDY
jgi:hypothetical protein